VFPFSPLLFLRTDLSAFPLSLTLFLRTDLSALPLHPAFFLFQNVPFADCPACSDGFLTLPDSRLIGVTVPPGVVLLVGSPLSDVLRTDAELLFPDGLPAEAGAPFPDGLLPRPSFARALPSAFPSLRTVRFRAF